MKKTLRFVAMAALILALILVSGCAKHDNSSSSDSSAQPTNAQCEQTVTYLYDQCQMSYSENGEQMSKSQAYDACAAGGSMWQCVEKCASSFSSCDALGQCAENCIVDKTQACQEIAYNLYEACNADYVDPQGNKLTESEADSYCVAHWDSFWVCVYEAMTSASDCAEFQANESHCQ